MTEAIMWVSAAGTHRRTLTFDAAGVTDQAIAQSVGCSRSTVQECLRRARATSIGWPLPETTDDAALKGQLCPRAAAAR